MSAKKKPQNLFSDCTKCGCLTLNKDAAIHNQYCGKPLQDSKISLLLPNVALKGYFTEIDKIFDYIPSDNIGWTRTHSILLNPQTMELLRINPRCPLRLSTDSNTIIGVAWPCKEVPALKIALSSRLFHPDEFCFMEIIHETSEVTRLEVSIKNNLVPVDKNLVEYLEVYLSNSYLEPDIEISVNYYGIKLSVIPNVAIDSKLNDLSLNEGEIVSTVYRTSSYVTICTSLIDIDIAKNPEERMNAFNLIGGFKATKKALQEFILDPFLSGRKSCSILMWGLPGSGKTKLLKAVEYVLGTKSFYFDSLDDFAERMSLIPAASIVILDWISIDTEHNVFPKLEQFLKSGKIESVILSVRQAESLDLGIRVRFPVEVELEVPNESERLEILQTIISFNISHDFITQLSKNTHGFTAGDLVLLLQRSTSSEGSDLEFKLEKARKLMRPTGIRQFILEVPDVKWTDIGGNEELKQEIQQAVIWPHTHKEAYRRFGIEPPSGILLYGPPGCSKTLVARALANEAKMNFLSVKGPELFSKWVGESEKGIRDLFARARQVAPTIIFFDEIDAVGASRGSEKSSGVSDRVLTQLLTELDGLEKNSGVVLLAATNRPDQLDSALLRPGRLDRSIHVGLPSPPTRKAVLLLKMKKMPIGNDIDINVIVSKTEGYSGAELVAVCQNAALVAMREDVEGLIMWKHFEAALKTIVPRTEQYMLDVYHQFQEGCVSN